MPTCRRAHKGVENQRSNDPERIRPALSRCRTKRHFNEHRGSIECLWVNQKKPRDITMVAENRAQGKGGSLERGSLFSKQGKTVSGVFLNIQKNKEGISNRMRRRESVESSPYACQRIRVACAFTLATDKTRTGHYTRTIKEDTMEERTRLYLRDFVVDRTLTGDFRENLETLGRQSTTSLYTSLLPREGQL